MYYISNVARLPDASKSIPNLPPSGKSVYKFGLESKYVYTRSQNQDQRNDNEDNDRRSPTLPLLRLNCSLC